MNCKNCGAQLLDGDQFCKNCGAQVNSQMNQTNNTQPVNMANINTSTISEPVQNQPIYTQPMNNQPVYSNNVPYTNNGQNNQTPKNNNVLKGIILGVAVAFVCLSVVCVCIFIINKSSENNGGSGNGTQIGGNNTQDKGTVNTYSVKFNGFTFKIPTNLVYEIQSDSVLIGDEDGTWSTYIEVLKGSYNQILSNKNQIPANYQKQGYISSSAEEKNIGGVNFITIELSKDGNNILIGVTKANSMYVFGTTTYTLDNEYNYDILKTISTILSSAEFNNETNNMSTFEKVDMSGILDLAKE